MFASQKDKLIKFQLLNLGLSIVVWLLFPISVAGVSAAYPLYTVKSIALIWLCDYPKNRSKSSLIFFLLACADTVTMFIYGSFSIYSLALSRIF